MSENWIWVCESGDIDEEDVMRFDYADETYCLYNTEDGFFASDGFCTHEKQHLSDGLVFDNVIECPLHQGRFDIASGKALGAPVCVDLKTYPVKLDGVNVYIKLP